MLARDLELDVSILGATIETIAGEQAGRTRLAVPGDPSVVERAERFLVERGVSVEVVSAP
jgi:D-methionine transport system ATP-binding protein